MGMIRATICLGMLTIEKEQAMLSRDLTNILRSSETGYWQK